MPFAELDAATRVHYLVAGEPGDETTPDLVLVHGTGGGALTTWAHLMEPFGAGRRRVIAIDYSGSGETTDDGASLTLERLAAQVRAVIDEAVGDDRPFDLLGFSLGACVATQLAASDPRGLRRLMLLSGWIDTTGDARAGLQFGLWRRLHATDPQALAEHLALTGFSAGYYDGRPTKAVEQSLATTIATLAPGFDRQCELDTRVDLTTVAPLVTAPTLAIVATDDQMVPPHHGRALAAAIPGARVEELPSGHLSMYEVPAELTARVLAFLD
ncbi:MAG: alpha/beta hydrolase [Solirubrobacteraceae bacterium]|nr:alpha/beta hydrolase [Solirubrobacteraceae bacterium]